ncbi:NAD(P)-dependent oxidoreductase [Pedobacter glucosidilyticus]|uniref:NAD(P)-dependent oxidoreductase n=1 Tax=Pedobacter glucosidilyticus TaxID=1122941 RepID=UPI0004256D39|nr:NAD(P)-dependent oxidoreductase [Pedobacter glucosidilyticus]
MRKPLIAILNSSTFGKHFAAHMSTLEAFADIKHITVPSDIDGDALAEHLKDADGIIASVTPKIPRATLEKCKNLVLLVRHGIGCDNVDLEAATELGIMVSRVKGIIEKEAVAEYAISLLMAGSRKLVSGSRAVRDSAWSTRAGMIGMEIKGKTIGIIGLGNIGSRSSEILAKGFGANVVASDPYIAKDRFAEFGAKEVSLDELIKTSNAILFHCPLTDETRRMLGKAQFDSMQKDAVLVNTCRGELVDEDALFEALQNGTLGCYATDVVEGEPIDGNHRLAKLENTIITPHLGGYSWESLHGMGQTCVDDAVAVFQNNGIAGELANPEVLQTKRRVWASQ